MAEPAGPRAASFAGGVAVVLMTLALVGAIRWTGPAIYDGDGWYHVKYAEVLRHDGISRTFPWFQESFLKDRFTDFNLLYHLSLIPFTLGDPLTGARIASVLFAATTMGLFWGTARALRVPAPGAWAVALLALAPEFTYRLTYTRPFVLAIGLGIAGTGAILLGKRRLAFVLALVYTYLHCSFHLLPCVAFLHDVVRDRVEGESPRARFRMTLWTLGGVAVGSLLTPYFPNNLPMWWVTNVDVLRASWAMGDALRVGTEMLPLPVGELFAANREVFAVFVGALALIAWRRALSEQARTLLPIALGFLALSFLSQRFVELWAPFTFLLAAVAMRDLVAARAPFKPALKRVAVGAVIVVVVIAFSRTLAENRAAAAAEDPPEYLEAGAWMKDNVPAGETIFNLGWDEFPQLFYADGTHNYLIGQDATFMWVTDPTRTRLWVDVAHGRVADLHATILGAFGCRWVFVPKRYVTFTEQAGRDPRFHVAWSNGTTSVVRLDDDGTTVGPWRAGPGRDAAWQAPGFVDLAKMFGATESCATVHATVTAPTSGPAELGLTTDDDVKLYVAGELRYEQPPGGPPVSLDAVFAGAVHGVREQLVPVTLQAGANEIVVKACRYGDDFGFVLRRRASAANSEPAAPNR